MMYAPCNIRNFVLVGNQSTGKTLLSEAMLACSGRINRMGSIEAGNTVSDYHATEKERRISVHASLLNCCWMDQKFNIVDTPGSLDFISEALGALRVSDFAALVVRPGNGKGIAMDHVWDYADRYGLPKMIIVNGLDKENVDFDATMYSLSEYFGRKLFPMTVPINPGKNFSRVLDVMRSEEVVYSRDRSGEYEELPLEGGWNDRVRDLHSELIELVAESDDNLLAHFFEEGNLTEEELRSGVHAAIQAETFIPVFAVSAINNVGVARLMDMIAKYGSSPVDRTEVSAIDEDGIRSWVSLMDTDPCCYVWKTISEQHVGELSFCRMMSGELHSGDELYNANRKMVEKIGQVFSLQGHERSVVDGVGPGDIAVMAKLHDTHTGNTLSGLDRELRLPMVVYPKPCIHASLQCLRDGDEDRLADGLVTLHEEDPTFLFVNSEETGELVVSGQGELHLEVIQSRLKNRFGVAVEFFEPRIAFRETIDGGAESTYRHKKQSGGSGQFAEVCLRIRPGKRDSGLVFRQSLTGNNVDRVFVQSVEKGVRMACQEGVVSGYRVTDVDVEFFDGKMHPVDSKDIAFQVAGKEAFKAAFLEANPCMLEPILSVEVKVPEDRLGDVLSDLSSRRGTIHGVDVDGGQRVVDADVPQSELHRYATTLRSLTGGTGIHIEEFSHYDTLSADLEKRMLNRDREAMH